jgi:hypothetical protein
MNERDRIQIAHWRRTAEQAERNGEHRLAKRLRTMADRKERGTQ